MSPARMNPPGLESLVGKKAALFSKLEVDRLIDEEVRHDKKLLTADTDQSLQSFSSGERKRALFKYLRQSNYEFLILDNPFDHLDAATRLEFSDLLQQLSEQRPIIQFASRQADFLSFIQQKGILIKNQLRWVNSERDFWEITSGRREFSAARIPVPLEHEKYEQEYLIRIKNLDVSYGEKKVLHRIKWDIRPGEYWELAGKNGSGKTTILSMITGDNPKGYGQEVYLFGQKKGSGESIWEIKKKIGYFTPSMIDRFRGYHSIENMLISGLLDSIGLYVIPNEAQKRVAKEWLALVGMERLSKRYFHDLSTGQQRLIMCIRAMIKHPLLLILDEPTAGLDDYSAAHIVSLVNKMATQSHTTIVFVSHRKEPGLEAEKVYQLEMSDCGSEGKVVLNKP